MNPVTGEPMPATWESPHELEEQRQFALERQRAEARVAEEIAARSKAIQDAQ